ncbi:hypothetical protein GOP47_0008838 [Adiantum capillus-veneris]|uniref:Uncharacterized protein n=1 Tax=Adiantum capillus-veneris TaxID=13818 RepID=A0A9D4V017_ADICA|nr:hypothetical protein GOP47_0008838 [Adiantum capillus-veneris]
MENSTCERSLKGYDAQQEEDEFRDGDLSNECSTDNFSRQTGSLGAKICGSQNGWPEAFKRLLTKQRAEGQNDKPANSCFFL